jgi:predicted RNase H-like nuclease (RuvC/YqgF family)
MLAPLKNRSLIERELPCAPEERLTQLESVNLALRNALRQSRQALKHSATLGAQKIVAQANEISRLETLLQTARQRNDALESGLAIVELGQRLMALSEANDRLTEAASRVWLLDKTLCAAHDECARLANERDRALRCLAANTLVSQKYCN